MEHPHLNFVQVPRAFTSVCQVFYVLLPVAVKFWGNVQASNLKEDISICFFLKSHENSFRPTKAIVYEQTIDCVLFWKRKILILESLFLSLKYVFPSFLKHVCSVEDRNGPPGRTPA